MIQRARHVDDDYRRYLDTLGEQAEKHGCAIQRVHLLLTADREDGVAILMKHLGRPEQQAVGGEILVVPGTGRGACFGCYRYIELNPVRANILNHPWEYRWSSYRD